MPNKKTMKKGLQTRISYVNLTLENLMVERREHDMKIVGERMKKLREEAGISQNKLAKLIGIQQSSLNRYESGFSNPTPETLLWFGDFFDVSEPGTRANRELRASLLKMMTEEKK